MNTYATGENPEVGDTIVRNSDPAGDWRRAGYGLHEEAKVAKVFGGSGAVWLCNKQYWWRPECFRLLFRNGGQKAEEKTEAPEEPKKAPLEEFGKVRLNPSLEACRKFFFSNTNVIKQALLENDETQITGEFLDAVFSGRKPKDWIWNIRSICVIEAGNTWYKHYRIAQPSGGPFFFEMCHTNSSDAPDYSRGIGHRIQTIGELRSFLRVYNLGKFE